MFKCHLVRSLLLVTVCAAFVHADQPPAKLLDPIRMEMADQIIGDAIGRGDIPGAVLLVGRGDQNVYLKAYGNRAVQPQPLPMKPDTIFDMASLSKSVGCATSIMILADRGKLKVS